MQASGGLHSQDSGGALAPTAVQLLLAALPDALGCRCCSAVTHQQRLWWCCPLCQPLLPQLPPAKRGCQHQLWALPFPSGFSPCHSPTRNRVGGKALRQKELPPNPLPPPQSCGHHRLCTSGQEQPQLQSGQQSHLFHFPALPDLQVETHTSAPQHLRGSSRHTQSRSLAALAPSAEVPEQQPCPSAASLQTQPRPSHRGAFTTKTKDILFLKNGNRDLAAAAHP